VLRAANAIISKNTERRAKKLFTSRGEGDPLLVFEGETERDEAELVARTIDGMLRESEASPRDFALFYRTNGQSRVLEEALRGRDIPYTVVGGTRFYDRAEIKDLIAYLRVLQNPDDGIGLLRIINTPARGIGDSTVERIAAVARERKISMSDAVSVAADDPELLGAGPRRKVCAFRDLMAKLRAESAGVGPATLAERVLEESGYRDALAADASLEAEGRMENLLELVAQMREYEREAEEPTLAGFLERIALASDVDGYDPEKGAVSLMTVHTAKGLEFPYVFLTGLEEGVFPHQRSLDDDAQMEEERRLCYVAVTRAMKKLTLTRVRRRRLSGQELGGVPSRFLRDLPEGCYESVIQPRPAYYDEVTQGQGPWGGGWTRPGSWDPTRGRSAGRPSFARAAAPAKAPAAQPGELTVHYDDDASGSEESHGLRIGAKVRHPQFGVGDVRGWQAAGPDSKDLKVTVRFPSVGVKTILARFLTRA
jgi:DNA helicase II / ATP-dependent DNA helicase PcrA